MKPAQFKHTPTRYEMDARDFCNNKGVDVDMLDNFGSWSVWISYPSGLDRVFANDLNEEEAWVNFYAACVYAAEVWYEVLKEQNTVPKAPPLPPVPPVPTVSKIPVSVSKVSVSVPKPPISVPAPPVPRVPPLPPK